MAYNHNTSLRKELTVEQVSTTFKVLSEARLNLVKDVMSTFGNSYTATLKKIMSKIYLRFLLFALLMSLWNIVPLCKHVIVFDVDYNVFSYINL